MNKAEIISHCEEDTKRLAKKLSPYLQTSDIIVLSGDLGSGKTKFVEGFLSFFGLENEISSPTFTIVNEYIHSNTPIFHFDVYRLEDSSEFYEIGGEEYFERGICLIEWGEIIEDILPDEYIKISFKRSFEEDDKRTILIETYGKRFEKIINEYCSNNIS